MKLSRKLLSSAIFLAMSSHFLRAASDIIIGGADSDIMINPAFTFVDATNNGGTSNLSAGTLIGASGLGMGHTTVSSQSAGGSAGTITVTDAIIWSTNNSLTLDASSTIEINGAITNNAGNTGSLILDTSGSVIFNSDISMTNVGSTLTVWSSGISQPSPSRTLQIGGLATFNAGSGNISLLSNNNFGSINLTGGTVAVTEAGPSLLDGVSAGTLTLTSAGAVTDGTDKTITVNGLATINAGGYAITLGNEAGDTINFGSLNVTGTAITITEDSDTELAGVNASSSLTLTSSGNITDSGTINVTGLANFNSGTGNITLGGAGENTNFNSLRFNTTGGSVSIQEDSAISLSGASTSGSLSLSSAGAVTNLPSATLNVANNASFSGTSITLGGQTSDLMNFGSLTFNSAGNVAIFEDSATVLSGSSTAATSSGNFILTSAGNITDVAASSLSVSGIGSFQMVATGSSIVLDDTAITTGGSATFTGGTGQDIIVSNTGNTFNGIVSFSGTLNNVSVYDTTDFDIRPLVLGGSLTAISEAALTDSGVLSISGLATLGGSTIDIGGAGESTNFGSLNFNSSGTAGIQEDSATIITGSNSAGALTLTSAGSITDLAGTSLAVTNNAAITSATGTSIILDDTAFNVDGNTTLTAGSGQDINISNVGNTFNGTVTFVGSGGSLANVNVRDTNAFDLKALTLTGNLNAISGAALTDSGDLSVTGLATLGGNTILIGGVGETTNFGSLNFNSAGSVTIQEDTSTLITGTNTGGSLVLTSAAAITNNAGASVTIGNNASFTGTSIALGNVSGDTMNFGSLTFSSAGAVTIQEDSSTLLTGSNTGLSLSLGSTSDITNNTGTSLTIDNNANLSGANIALGNMTGDSVHFGSLTFNSAGAVTIHEDSSTLVTGANTGLSLALHSTDGITNNASSSIGITNNASFSGTSITLGNMSGDAMNFGSLTFNSTGAVTIQEDSSSLLSGTNSGLSLALGSAGDITNNAGTSVTIDNNASFSGSNIALGNMSGDTMNFGSLSFNSAGAVTIQEDSATLVTGANTGLSLSLSSAGDITNNASTSIGITNNASLSGTNITLGTSVDDLINFGSLTFNSAGAVEIEEDSSTLLTGSSTGLSLALSSSGDIANNAGANVTIDNNADLSGTSITLGNMSGDSMNFGSLTFNSAGAVLIQEDSATLITGANTGLSLSLGSAGDITNNASTSIGVTNNASLSGTNITLGTSSGDLINFGSLTFASGGAVEIEEDSSTLITGSNSGLSLALSSTAQITNNAGADITIDNNASLSGTSITLGTSTGDSMNFGSLTFNSAGAVQIEENSSTLLVDTSRGLSLALTSSAEITNDTTTDFGITNNASLTGTSITLGTFAGDLVNFGSLTFNSTGAVQLEEDSSSLLTGANTGLSLSLTSTAGITNNAGTSVIIDNNAYFSGSSIELGTSAGDSMNFGSLTFNSIGAVTIQEDSSTLLVGTSSGLSLALSSTNGITNNASTDLNIANNASLSGTSITLGTSTGDLVKFGSLTFNSAGDVEIEEDSGTLLTGTSTGLSLSLSSTAGITNNASTDITIDNNASLSGTSITLGTSTNDQMNFGSLTFHSAGAVEIEEDSSTLLTGSNTGLSLALSSADAISNNAGASVAIENNAYLNGNSITLGTATGDSINFGSLTFDSAGAVTIEENSSTLLTGTSSGLSLSLDSSGGISNDTTTNLAITNNARFNGTSITLGTSVGDAMNFGTLTFQSAGNVTIEEDSAMSILGTNTGDATSLTSTAGISDAASSSITVGDLTLNGTSISLGEGATNTFNAGSVNFNSAGAVSIEENSGMGITGINTGGTTLLTSTGAITDTTTSSITVGDLTLSGNSVNLGIGSSNTLNANTLNFNVTNLVAITENSDMDITGSNTAGSVNLTSQGDLSDAGAVGVNITGQGDFTGTTISLGGGTFNTGSLTFNASGAVSISEDSDMSLVGNSSGGNTNLSATGEIVASATSSIQVSALTLGGSSISVGVGAGNTFNASTLNFNSAGAVAITENSNMDIVGVNTAGSASLSSQAALSDAGASSIDIAGLGSFSATSIDLGGGQFNSGTLTFNSSGVVNIREDSDMDIVGVNTGAATQLTSTSGGISDSASSSISVGSLVLNGASISLGVGGSNSFSTGTLNFTSAGSVTIQENGNMDLVGVNTAGSLALTATGALSDAGVTGLNVTGLASFSGASVNLGAGTFNAGSLTFQSAGTVTVSEDSAILIEGVNTGGVTTLSSTDGIADSANSSITVGALTMDGTSIYLGVGAGNTFNASSVNFTSTGDVTIEENSGMSLSGVNTASSASLSSTGALTDATATSLDVVGLGSFRGSSIALGGGIFNTGSLTFHSAGAVTISEDSSMDIVGTNTGATTSLTSAAGIADSANSSISVGALSLNGTSIQLGAGAGNTFHSGTLKFNSAGAVSIDEDSGMKIVGSNTAAATSLSSTGAIADSTNSRITVGALSLGAASIDLGAGVGNSFNADTLNFNSAGTVGITEDSDMKIVGSNTGGATTLTSTGAIADSAASSIDVGALSLNGTSIYLGVGNTNTFKASTLSFATAGAVTIHEDNAMKIDGVNTGGATKLRSTAAISDSTTSSIAVGSLALNGASISIGVGSGNTFHASNLNFNSSGGVTLVENSSMKVFGSNTGAATNLYSTAGLSDSTNSSIQVGALALRGSSLQLGVGSGNTVNADTLNFNSAGAVSVEENSGTNIVGVNTAGSANLTSVAEIIDVGTTSLNITGLGQFNGTSISLGDGTFNAGSLTFQSPGAVSIAENSAMKLAGTNNGGVTNLNSTGSITDSATSTIQVGALTLEGSSISLGVGTGNTFDAGTLNFQSAGKVVIEENSSTQLAGNSNASSLELSSTGSVTTGGNLNVAGLASFSGTSLTLGSGAQTTNFGSLKVNSTGLVSVQEDSNSSFVGANKAATLRLLSSGTTTFTTGATLAASNLQLQTQSLVLTGNNLVDTMALTLANGTTLTLTGSDTVGSVTSNGGTIAGKGILSVARTAMLNGGTVSGNLRGNTTSTKDVQVTGTLGGGVLNVTGGTLALSGTAGNKTVNVGANGRLLNQSSGLASDASVTNAGVLTMSTADTVSTYTQNGAGILSGNLALTATNGATLSGGQILGYLLGNTRTTGDVLVSGRLGGGRLTVAGGTLNLTGTSTNGVVDVLGASPVSTTGGTLVVAKGGLASNANVINAGKLVINANDAVKSYTQNGNGTLAGTASLSVRDGATLNGGKVVGSLVANTISKGNVKISGTVQGDSLSVASGKLILTGTATADTKVNAGAILQGKGVIVGDLTNVGTTSRSLTVNGDLVTTGTVSLNIRDRRSFDKIVADTAVLGGKLVVKNTGSGLQSGDRVKIIDADVYQNEFTSFVAKGFENGVIFDERTGILVGLGRDIFKSAGSFGDNARKSSGYLNLDKNQSGTYLALFEDSVDIGRQNVAVVDGNVRITSGVTNGDQDLVDALFLATTNTPGQIDADVVNRLSPEVYGSMSDYTKMAIQAHARQAVEAAPVAAKGKTQVFATLHSSTAGVDDTATNAGYDIDMNGATAGVRHDVNEKVRIGGLLGADDGSISGALIDADAQGFVLGTFGSYHFKDSRDTTIHAGLSYGSYEHDATRRSLVGDVTADGVGSSAFELVLGASTALYQKDKLRISGSGGFRYMAGEVDSFVENGAGIQLAVDSQDIDAFLLDVGFDLDYQITEKFSVAGRLGYIHELSGSDNDVSSAFVASGAAAQPFSVISPGLDDQAFILGLGLFYDINENARVGITYRGEFGSDSSPVQTFGIGASFGF